MAVPTVRRRLVYAFLTILALFAVNQSINLWSDWARSRALDELNTALSRRIRISSVRQQLADLRKETTLLGEVRFESGSAPDPLARKAFDDKLSRISSDIAILSREDSSGTRELVGVFAQLSELWSQFYDNLGVEPGWAVAFLARADPPGQRLLGVIVPRLETQGNDEADRARSQFETVTTRTRALALLIFLISVTVGIVVALDLSRYLVRRLTELGRGADLIGADHLDHRIAVEPQDELGDLAESFNEMAAGLDAARSRLRAANDELAGLNKLLSQRIEEELAKVRLAALIQRDLLPKKAPRIAGYDLAGRSIPAQTVGGDYFDFITMGEHEIALCLGDVSGKGLPASLLMANLQAAVRSQVLAAASVTECLRRTNTLLYRSTDPGRFVTAFFCALDHDAHQLRFSSAGHNPPILLRASGEAQMLEVGGLILGIMEDTEYQDAVCRLERDDVLVIYSDGISEAADAEGEEFGEQGIIDVLRRERHGNSETMLDAIVKAALDFSGDQLQMDDMTLIVLKRC